ncbi:DUF3822 family protein [Winogradskyella sp.]|uniref:DUF3822 family protein n=1 Tax=Winogradskyella sp. TaxID=1883156 RepID=UPI003F6C7542
MTKNNIKELSIQVNLNGLSFCILNRTSNTVELLKTIDFKSKLTPFDVLNRLKTELSSNTEFSDEFDSVLVIHQNELSTLVPKALYDDNLKADYLKFNSKILKTDLIAEDEITVNDSINVYVPYVNINNYIFETFGEFVYKHATSIFINSVLQHKHSEKHSEVYINVTHNAIELIVTVHGRLQLINVFDYTTKEDFIYYVLFVFEQLKLDAETTLIHLSGNIDKDGELYNVLYTYVRHIDVVKFTSSYHFNNSIDSDGLHRHYLILNSF